MNELNLKTEIHQVRSTNVRAHCTFQIATHHDSDDDCGTRKHMLSALRLGVETVYGLLAIESDTPISLPVSANFCS
jgi:hypothetical protein